MTKSSWSIDTYLPPWLRNYRREFVAQDLVAGFIVAIMLVPQSMAYALVAGLPAQYGMYASILPLLAYAALGSSMTLAVGPVAVTSLMTATTLSRVFPQDSSAYLNGAALLALGSGALLLLFGLLRLGFLAKLLSNPVISGFTSGASLLILIGQLNPLFGLHTQADSTFAQIVALLRARENIHMPTAAIGVATLLILFAAREWLSPLAQRLRMRASIASLLPKLMPMLIVIAAIVLTQVLHWRERYALAVVGAIPQGLPALHWPQMSQVSWRPLLFPMFAIGLINFVSSIAVAQALALRRKEKISADAELRALGVANIASALSGAFPVNGGFARSLVSFNAGARTPLAGVVTALLMALVVWRCTEIFMALPRCVLAATIIVAVAPVIDFEALTRAWRYDRADAIALAATAIGVVAFGVEAGIAIGIGVSLASLVWRSSNPHIAVLGRVPFTEHFRNVERYQTETLAHVLALRVDENLLFANAHAIEARVRAELSLRTEVRHVLLVLSSVSQIDATAMEMLLELNASLHARGIDFNFSEIKGPVLERLHHSPLLKQLTGKIYLSTHQAFRAFAGETEDYMI